MARDSDQDRENSPPPFTTSIDASIPNERIILVRYDEGWKKWIAVQQNSDGSLYEGVGNTESLARRIAALKGLQALDNKSGPKQTPASVNAVDKYLGWKNDLRALINKQRDNIDKLIFTLSSRDSAQVGKPDFLAAQSDLISIIIMMIQAVGVSCNSVYHLSSGTEMTIRDCFSIARSIVETSVNAAFIQAYGMEMAQRAHRHALQKYFRDLSRKAEIGGLEISAQYTGKVDPSTIPGLPEALAEFTTSKGREDRNWTPENIDQKIEIIASKYGEGVGRDFGVGRFAIYRHSSEIIHGTHFGARYFWQPSLVSDVGRSKESMIKYLFGHFFTVFNGIYFTVDALLRVFDLEYDLPEIRRAQEDLYKELCGLEFIKDKL